LFSNPFNFSDEELDLIDLNLQMEAVDFETSSLKKNKFLETRSSASDEISFWKLLPDSQFPNLKKFANKFICRFGTTYQHMLICWHINIYNKNLKNKKYIGIYFMAYV
jgi:hypothetical protein